MLQSNACEQLLSLDWGLMGFLKILPEFPRMHTYYFYFQKVSGKMSSLSIFLPCSRGLCWQRTEQPTLPGSEEAAKTSLPPGHPALTEV